jgi:uncharacterized protein with von Willebrand factor type A (vWA) domain
VQLLQLNRIIVMSSHQFTTQTEFVRLCDNEPLTLACSALADFLWSDFVRESRPAVKYLIDHYNIRQLSRFGKEVFDRLYNADEVNWLVTEDAYEDYFRRMCDGETSALPQGYKPENGIWHAIMTDLSNAAAWRDLLQHCVGDQFNSGNNAVSILNKLAEVIEEAISNQSFDVELLTNAADQLQQLREEFKRAQAAGDRAAVDKARQKGKQLNQAISEAIQQASEALRPQANKIVDQTLQESKDQNEQMSTLAGTTAGAGSKTADLKQKKELAQRLANNKALRQLAKKLGALKQTWVERKRAKKNKANYDCIVGAKFSDDLTRAFPIETALAGTEQGRALFALKFAHKTLLTKDYTATAKHLDKGPVVMYVDVSGSMSGERELWSKAITLVITEQALKENRTVYINLFDTRIDKSIQLKPGAADISTLLDFVAEWTLGGGTSFNAVVGHALEKGCKDPRADILMITDGYADLTDAFCSRLNTFKQTTGTQWSTVCVETDVPDICYKFSDEVFSVNLYNTENTIDAIQRCFR